MLIKNDNRKELSIRFLGQIKLEGTLICKTGLHIGGGNDDLKIGGIDKYVIKTSDNKPYIPGSSLKGKMRSLLEKARGKQSNRSGGTEKIFRYEADDINEALQDDFSRLFGATAEVSNKLNFPARLVVHDLYPIDYKLEIKSENTLDRLSAHANPRTNERVAKDSTFKLHLDYNIEIIEGPGKKLCLGNEQKESFEDYLETMIEDINALIEALILVEYSYLGGNGSRGYGQVSFEDLEVTVSTAKQILRSEAGKKTGAIDTLNAVKIKINQDSEEIKKYIAAFYKPEV